MMPDSRIKVVLATDAIFSPLTGVGRYAFEMATHLSEQAGIGKVKYFNGIGCSSTPIKEPPPRSDQARALRAWALHNRLVVAAYRFLTPAWRWAVLRRYGDHVFHSPNYFLPPFPGPRVATFHDLSHVRLPACHPPERVRFMEQELPITLRRADHIITVSEFSRREVIDHYGWPADKVTATPLAASAEYHPRSRETLAPKLDALGLEPGGYALFVGTIEPRKNLAVLLEAYAGLPLSLRTRYPLVLAGDRGWRSEDLHARIQKAQRQGWARYLGYVPEKILPALYAGARAFAYPSRYEGFGLPVLEAMASGVPVVCSHAASLPEVAGDAALQHDPDDVKGLRGFLRRALEDDAWRREAIAKGLARAQTFSWERTVAETVAVYRRLSV
ncbi:mannosyl-N-acetyl-alpha-D-glucosaminyl-diphospho-ditrans,octacis-undecaprenol 3-alpha-mannosyltransferase/alpha-1,3-rhamnosyltransferase [Methylomarinovum caldicuralii]|uniref:Mannosyl-N-acetyl-alpha-D-glucosaminyl-diphospho-ditrans,octacis-undecaprenol 3-alpha-mannosyltransferase/alpha-1,3-rhamnosyltransferase n=2 Tax=Methylomarinovum caldicuralii TaxID=438856 RepID=A0AAU9C8X2_9GAMM|nr:mannosyl-N-acetyl-alpha-D-glucosaminyl-diphospho-ditrans,octacis-undecaprenol 3-alpha-mannosyltransferase/alpha-1,3-rhamnosyltransferase [Methylomarinovum caldicuralii]